MIGRTTRKTRQATTGGTSPRKVAHLTTVDLSLRYLLLAQIEAGLDHGDEVLGISAAGPDVAFLEARGMRFIELDGSTRSMSLRGDLRAARSLWRTLRIERPDVLHTHNPKPGVYGRIVGRLAGVPRVVHTTHGLYAAPDDPLSKKLVVYGLEAVASRFSHVELVQNDEDLELMRRWRITPGRKLRLLGNGVDLTRFRPGDDDAAADARADLGIGPDEVVVGLVARLVAEKGVPELIEAVRRLGAPFRLLLIGPSDPDKADALPQAVLDGAERDGAIVTGHRHDVDRLYGAMDVFCLPSHREGFPRAAMEAAASGLPVVATNIRGCRQVVEPGVTGALVPVNDARSLAEALRLYADGHLRREHGGRARSLAERSFDERDVVDTVLAAYGRPSGVSGVVTGQDGRRSRRRSP
ncbi:MAG: glycosyltransferase family 4 protein [Acidimicrobiales bacterium]